MKDEVTGVGKSSEARIRANAKYNKKTYDLISTQTKKRISDKRACWDCQYKNWYQ